MFNYKPKQRENFFDYLANAFNLPEKAKVVCNKVIPFQKTLLFGDEIENLSIDIVTGIDNENNVIIATNGLSAIAGAELCVKNPIDSFNAEKQKLVIEKIYDYCNQLAKAFINENDGTTLTVDFSDIIGETASAEITNEVGTPTLCDGACEWLLSMCWILK